ncbi:MAG TPA: MqnA/MqnD/SBP family protein [Rhodothermia bacterium]|nr:MqnA/MqnD/SBP family protein [Rhodothermia bacterium]
MRIALWAIDPFTASQERFSELGWTVRFLSPRDCGRALLEGEVDLALIPSIEVLGNTAAYTVLPGVAFASKRRFPYVGLLMGRPVGEIRTIRPTPDAEPFYGLASVVLREQYDCRTTMVRDGEADSMLLFGPEAADAGGETPIDIGLEWFELTGTPLAWGFFCVRPGTIPDAQLAAVQDELSTALSSDQEMLDSVEQVAARPDLLVTYDPEVSEGIDELAHYLFYVGILDDIPALRLMATQN